MANMDITADKVGTHGNDVHANHSQSTSFLSRLLWNRSKLPSTQPTNTPITPTHSGTMRSADTQQRRPLNPTTNNTNSPGFGTFGRMAQDSNDQPPARASRFANLAAIFKRFMGFVGPGYSKSPISLVILSRIYSQHWPRRSFIFCLSIDWCLFVVSSSIVRVACSETLVHVFFFFFS